MAGLLLLNLSSCQKNEMLFLDLDAKPALNVWFGTLGPPLPGHGFGPDSPRDSVIHNFALQLPGIPASVMFHARLMGGVPADVDRTFMLEAVSGDIDKVDFVAGPFVLAAGEYQNSFPIIFNRPEDFNEFTETPGHIVFRLKENENFQAGAINRRDLHVNFVNGVIMPYNWYAMNVPSAFHQRMEIPFGAYSKVKHAFIVSVIGRELDFHIRISGALGPNDIPSTLVAFWRDLCGMALREHNAAIYPDYLRCENGHRITFPGWL